MKKYYLHNGTENIGPYDLDELKAKAITKNTQVWCDGMEDWKNAGEVEELKSILSVVPPPIAKRPEIKPEPIDSNKKTHWFWRMTRVLGILIIVFVAIIAFVDYMNAKNSSSSYEESIMTIGEMEVADPSSYLNATGTYKPTFLGDQLKINGIIENKATVTNYKDVVIEVIFYSKTNSEIAREQYTIYDFFAPNTKKEFKLKVKNYSNVETIGWNVFNATVK
ncbi:DUF4339 domain-containing protein [Flavobacterium xueshanense]|uniref:GYF domain-containing protein n=1 Tax=Flavobacterium xueshanense TaxID=935223 RepID=A0A1I2CGZ2_9FLAO|nr:DUF4339 domain-containing protein [Flavobacterium xueshanense]SFE67508.1 protein of unknown function [Flavobacterium xueshanense]